MFCSPPGRASAQLGAGRVKILRLAFQVTTASQQKKTPLFVFTSAPPATGQLLSRLITQPLVWLDLRCEIFTSALSSSPSPPFEVFHAALWPIEGSRYPCRMLHP